MGRTYGTIPTPQARPRRDSAPAIAPTPKAELDDIRQWGEAVRDAKSEDNLRKLSDDELKAEYEKRQERERINAALRQPAPSVVQLWQQQIDYKKRQADEWTQKRRAFEYATKAPAESIDEFEARRAYLKLEAEYAHPEAIQQAKRAWGNLVAERVASEIEQEKSPG